ncbi:primosomal protein N' [Priestia flexa]|uniref:primosomal protein N' n=1 Tax=Priestia flexa TaxID=86664 RepID=UPI000C240E24|nr:primosomal protein N' [Priestia flexa]MEC0665453.1 primosomal protein N' [Priestia flexa]WHX78152.1 primosomal protein N' [Priestia flexa]
MNFASVIVDVAAKQTDRAFDYSIPKQWREILVPGMRVIVPFGPRKVQGFVVDVKLETDVKRTKPIAELLDLTPVLTPELLELGHWLTEKTLCFKISAFQVMLPAAMKAKYDKKILLQPGVESSQLHSKVQPYFQHTSEVMWSDIEKSESVNSFYRDIQKGLLEVVYLVKSKGNKKTVKALRLAQPPEHVKQLLQELPKQAEKQKQVLEFMLVQEEVVAQRDIMTVLNVTSAPIKGLVSKGLLHEVDMEIYRDPYANRDFIPSKPFPLTDEQSAAIKPILRDIENHEHDVFLMYGVTGSGKTEVYLQSIDQVLKQGKEAIMLVPEISLTPQMVKRFKERFGSKVAVMHSGLSAGEKYDEWRKIQRKEVSVVVGARSAIFAPFQHVGIIIIDEEHETSYKQEENPRYHARDVAIKRAEFHNCPVILGSATPTLESFARAQKGVYKLLPLRERMNKSALPKVDIVDMREELRDGNRSMFSTLLLEKIRERLERREQIVLFLNKRGHSSFVMCRDCGYVPSCPHCEISLTYHRYQNRMKCHYCGYEEPTQTACPECESDHIRFFGSGTQKVEEELGKVLPEASVIRMDVDTTSRKGAHEKLLTKFGNGEAQILLGTQMIAKGLDFPNVTLVGVLSADTMLNLPDFRAAEKTFQLLTQVSGRAGRHHLPGEVVIQTYAPEHYSIQLASQHDYDTFYLEEMKLRQAHRYPPFFYLALVTVSHENVAKVVSVTGKISQYLRQKLSPQAVILGPVASPIAKIKDRYRYQCMIKYKLEPNMIPALKYVVNQYQDQMQQEQLTITIDLHPYSMM